MKTQFSRGYITDNCGCYGQEPQLLTDLFNKVGNNPTLRQLFDSIPIKDFCWFFVRKCDLNLEQKRLFAIECAQQVLPLYEKRYPNDNRVRNCIETTIKFLKKEETLDDLSQARNAAADAAYAADAAADAAYAAVDAADAAAAADTAAYAAYAAVDAADAAAAAAAFKEFVWNFVESQNTAKIS